MIRGCLWGSFWVPGATNFGSFFVKFRGGSPGSFFVPFWLTFGRLLVAFCASFGCLLGALGTFLEDFASTLAALETFVGLWAFGESLASFLNIFVNNLKMCFPGLC